MEQWKLTPARDLGMPLDERLRSTAREAGLFDFASHLFSSSAIKLYLHLYHRLKVAGRENLPGQGPFVLIANHCSHLDALALASAIPLSQRAKVFPIAAGDTFFSSRMLGVFSVLVLNALPVWRRKASHHALAELRHRLVNDGPIYILFPEGTRSRSGEMGAFRSGLGMLVAGTEVPVVPCRLEGTFGAMPAGRNVPRPYKVTLTIGRPMRFSDAANNREGWEKVAALAEAVVRAPAASTP